MKSIVGTIDRVAFSFGPFTLYWYGLIIAGIALAAIAAIWLLGPQISQFFTDIGTQLAL